HRVRPLSPSIVTSRRLTRSGTSGCLAPRTGGNDHAENPRHRPVDGLDRRRSGARSRIQPLVRRGTYWPVARGTGVSQRRPISRVARRTEISRDVRTGGSQRAALGGVPRYRAVSAFGAAAGDVAQYDGAEFRVERLSADLPGAHASGG